MSEILDMHQPLLRWLKSENLEYIHARTDCESTIESGWPDITVIHTRLPALLIELKTEKGKLSQDQDDVHSRLRSKGYRVHVIRRIEDAYELVRAWRLGIENETPAYEPSSKAYIQNRAGHGDWIFTPSGKPLRKATIDDLSIYNRK